MHCRKSFHTPENDTVTSVYITKKRACAGSPFLNNLETTGGFSVRQLYGHMPPILQNTITELYVSSVANTIKNYRVHHYAHNKNKQIRCGGL